MCKSLSTTLMNSSESHCCQWCFICCWLCVHSGCSAPSQSVILLFSFLGEPKVTLSEDCYGEVRINNTSVCHRNWKPEYSDLVCQEKGCGNVVPHSSVSKRLPKDESYHVSCEEYHYKLGQCNRYKAKCEDVVYVYCSGKYVQYVSLIWLPTIFVTLYWFIVECDRSLHIVTGAFTCSEVQVAQLFIEF